MLNNSSISSDIQEIAESLISIAKEAIVEPRYWKTTSVDAKLCKSDDFNKHVKQEAKLH